jgi:Cof subfamily protein (haloacid dehalogenase superfamily)
MIRLIAYDLDGTLVGRDNAVRPGVRREIARVRSAGIAGCVVTGRMYQSALPIARELELDAPMVCYHGAAIVDPQTDDVLFDMPLPNTIGLEIVRLAKGDGMHVQLYRNDNYYCERRTRFAEMYAQISGVDPIIVPSLEEAFTSSDTTKAVVIADAETAAGYAERMRAHLGKRAYVTRSYPEFVEMLNPFVDKGEALEFVAARLGIAMSDVMAIGDSWNDEPLLRVAGTRIAMGSAPEELKHIADAIVADVAHDGVAEALARYVSA